MVGFLGLFFVAFSAANCVFGHVFEPETGDLTAQLVLRAHVIPVDGPNHVPQFGLVLSWRRHKDTPRVEGRVRSFHVEKFGALEHGFFDLRTAAAPGKNDNKTGYYFPNFPANFSLFAPSAAIDFPRVGEIFQFQVTEIEENSSGEVLCYFFSIFLTCV
eukprot:TRINITY_DN517_c0_g1_i4.p1 TRINITY_DN517_c0_g1~~TRINITY_DN517_c0_g1_i4.p1  ORF type:complete len:169 (-),score=33.54 TRINITY_DN517_c0_g1_i4:292-768(-)